MKFLQIKPCGGLVLANFNFFFLSRTKEYPRWMLFNCINWFPTHCFDH